MNKLKEDISLSQYSRRNRLAYLALYYAIQGNTERSEKIRKLVVKLDSNRESIAQ